LLKQSQKSAGAAIRTKLTGFRNGYKRPSVAAIVKGGVMKLQFRILLVAYGLAGGTACFGQAEVPFAPLLRNGDEPLKRATLQQLNQAGAMICMWEPGNTEPALGILRELRLDVVYTSPFRPAATCRWKEGALNEQSLKTLAQIELITFFEAAPEIGFASEPGKSSKARYTIADFESAGAMTCEWKREKKDEAIKALETLGLEVEYISYSRSAAVCKWKQPLKPSVLASLRENPLFVNIEPASAIQLPENNGPIRVAVGTDDDSGTETANNAVRRPNDPKLSDLWGLEHIHAPNAWASLTESRIFVAVVDTGVDYEHPDLKGNIWHNSEEIPRDGIDNDKNGIIDDYYGASFIGKSPVGDPRDGHGHGTHVAGTIGATGDNRIGVVGVNWKVGILPVRVLDDQGKSPPGRTLALADALQYARTARCRPRVINLSLFWPGAPETCRVIGGEIAECKKAGILVVCAAENERRNIDYSPPFPASYKGQAEIDNIMVIAALNRQGEPWEDSNYGEKWVDLFAPGDDIFSTWKNSAYHRSEGTSMAAAYVSGAAALIWEQYSHDERANYAHVRDSIMTHATKADVLTHKCASGGTLDIGFLRSASE